VIYKKSVSHFLEETQMKYRFKDIHRSAFAVEKMCRTLGVSRTVIILGDADPRVFIKVGIDNYFAILKI